MRSSGSVLLYGVKPIGSATLSGFLLCCFLLDFVKYFVKSNRSFWRPNRTWKVVPSHAQIYSLAYGHGLDSARKIYRNELTKESIRGPRKVIRCQTLHLVTQDLLGLNHLFGYARGPWLSNPLMCLSLKVGCFLRGRAVLCFYMGSN